MDVQTARQNIRDHLLLLRELGFLCLEPPPSTMPDEAGPAATEDETAVRAPADGGGVVSETPAGFGRAATGVAGSELSGARTGASSPPGGPLSARPGWPAVLFSVSARPPLAVIHPPFGVGAALDAIDLDELVKHPTGGGEPGSSGKGVGAVEAETPDLFGEPQTPPPIAPHEKDRTDQTDQTDQPDRTDGSDRSAPGMPSEKFAEPGASAAPTAASSSLSREERIAGLSAIALETAACRNCRLVECRTNIVPGQGNPEARIVFVGEGPGETEDHRGQAFVGKAGRLLTDMIHAMGLTREDVFICNVVKCRPPGNRNPEPDEMTACEPFLKRQLAIIRPTVIVALGAVALKCLLGDPKLSITRIRGNWRTYESIPLMPTFHPSYLLRMPSEKVKAWEDLQKVMRVFGLEPKSGKRGTPE